jgi:UDP-N-acetyl-2-amino-2-deoxyglucuronate dehydrogenase
MTNMKTLRLGIIGLGAEGGLYAGFLTEGKVKNMVIGAICDNDPAKKELSAEKYPEVPFFNNYIDMMESGRVDAIVTCVPHYLHPEIGINALKRNIHALVEKPAGVYTKQVKELNEFAATKPELTFAIFFNQRANPLYQKLKELIDNGEIGNIRRTNWIITTWWRPQGYYDQGTWRATWSGEGGGVLVNQAPHQLDLLQWICGMPQKVYSNVKYGYQRNIAVEDEVTAMLDYGNGATGVFVTCTHDVLGTDRLEILGDKGKIVVDGSKKITIKRLHKPESEMSSTMSMQDVMKIFMGQDSSDIYSEEVLEFNGVWGTQHITVLDNFAANVIDGTPLIAPGSDGIHGVRLANAIHLSSWLDKEVEIPFDEDLYLAELNKKIDEEKRIRSNHKIILWEASNMKKGKIGVQMMMLKGKVEELGVYETMRKMNELGYRCVEVSQIPMTEDNVSELKRACVDFKIEIASLSAAIEPMMPGIQGETLAGDFDKIVNDCKTLNCKFLRIGMLPFTVIGSKDKIMEFVKRADAMAERLAEYDIELYYHNHHIEFQKYDGEYLLDIIKNNTTHLGFEMDVHWIQRGGENPVEFIKKYAGRIALLHLKDYRIGQLDLDLSQGFDMNTFTQAFSNVIEFAEVGEGNLDIKGIIEAGLESGSQYFLVEQDDVHGRDPFDCLKTSGDNLRKMGYADWF